VCAAMDSDLDWMPQGGAIYTAWAELTDLYDTEKTPIEDAYAALRQATADWLDRPGPPTGRFVNGWLERTQRVIRFLFDRDGGFRRSPG